MPYVIDIDRLQAVLCEIVEKIFPHKKDCPTKGHEEESDWKKPRCECGASEEQTALRTKIFDIEEYVQDGDQ